MSNKTFSIEEWKRIYDTDGNEAASKYAQETPEESKLDCEKEFHSLKEDALIQILCRKCGVEVKFSFEYKDYREVMIITFKCPICGNETIFDPE